MSEKNNTGIVIAAAEPVAYDFTDDAGKHISGMSCKVCVCEYKDGECVAMTVQKATADFANAMSDKLGVFQSGAAIAYDRNKRAAFLVAGNR